jgi:spermidine/putrescine transport system ATP-binding protein
MTTPTTGSPTTGTPSAGSPNAGERNPPATATAGAATGVEAAVSLRGLTKAFAGNVVVDDLDLDVGSGELFSLLGPSGCGKTTTLRMIAGFSDPTSGSVLVGGEDVTSTPPHQRDVNTVFQSYALFEHLDVRRNVGFGLRRKGVDRSDIDRRVAEMLELVELGPRAGDRPAELSGGQRQRVALARALINRPKVLLLDEPLAALDLKLRHAMQAELKAIQREVGITFLFVTHDQDEALSMSDRVAIMNGGVIEQCGTPEDVYENPTSVFAAEFIGTSNLITGTYADGSVDVTAQLSIPVPAHRGSVGGDRMSVAIRPEKIWMSDFTPAMVQTPGTIVSTSYHGATTQYLVDVGPGVTLTVLEQNLPRMRADDRWEPGDRVQLGWLPEHAVVLR